MPHTARGISLAATLALISRLTGIQSAQAQSTPSTSAHVYIQIQGPAGAVYGLNASSTGQLSTISGSPYKLGTQIIGSTKSQFVTLGHTLLHSYGVASNGAIQSQLSQIPVVNYAGSSCGGPQPSAAGALLDHTGKNVYVMIDPDGCTAYQSYIINSDGSFTFNGDSELPQNLYGSDLESVTFGLPSILGAETYAYAEYGKDSASGDKLVGFRRESSGALQSIQFSETDPTPDPNFHGPDASPTGNYIVVQLTPNGSTSEYLVSYTVDSHGNLSTTNTTRNMPITSLRADWNTMSVDADRGNSTFSPAGNLFVLYGGGGTATSGTQYNGIEIYQFNGANPLTLHKKLLTGSPIDQVAWDSSNHLYAISNSDNKLYVFTVTSTSVTEDATWSINAPFKMVVVSTSSGTGSPASQYSDPLIDQSGSLTVGGQVTVDTSGNTTVKVTGQQAAKTYTLQFCPAFLGSNTPPACFNITTFSTDSSGNGSSKVMFPKSGDWAGEFSVKNSGGTAVVASGLFPNVSNESYLSTLLPESKTNGGAVTTSKTQDPLGNGSVSYSNGTLLFNVNGATPSTNYQINETEGPALYSSNTYAIGSFTTNGSGTGSASVDLATASSNDGDMFNIEGGSGAGFIGGFSIP